MTKTKMNATIFFRINAIIIILVIGVSIAGFCFVKNQLSEIANTISSDSQKTATSKSDKVVASLISDVSKNRVVIDEVTSITIPNQDYRSQVIQDLSKIATNTGVSISNFNFEQSVAESAIIANIEIKAVTITLDNPINFTNLMSFIKNVENSLPKMQFTSMNINRDSSTEGFVRVDPLTIEIYTR